MTQITLETQQRSGDLYLCEYYTTTSTSHITRLPLLLHGSPHYLRRKIFQEDLCFTLRRTALSSLRGRPNHLYAQLVGFRNIRQPPADYRRGPTGNTKHSVSPSQMYPYHLSTDDCRFAMCTSQAVETHRDRQHNVCWLHRWDIKPPTPISTADVACSPVSKF